MAHIENNETYKSQNYLTINSINDAEEIPEIYQ